MVHDKQSVSEDVAVSKEEADALMRSRKKLDNIEGSVQGGRPLVARQKDWMIDDPISHDKEKIVDTTKQKSYRDACVSDDVLLNDLEDKEDGWWHDEGWKSSISVDTTWKIPNIVLSEELRVKMHG